MLAYHSVERDVLNVLNEIWNVYKKIKIQNVTQTNFMAKCNQTKVEDETEKENTHRCKTEKRCNGDHFDAWNELQKVRKIFKAIESVDLILSISLLDCAVDLVPFFFNSFHF